MTTDAAGLRLNETLHLRVTDIDSARMTIRVEQGKGGKDRYTVLSRRLLEALRVYWKSGRPSTWLFPSQETGHPLHPTALQRAYQQAKLHAGVTKPGGIHGLRHDPISLDRPRPVIVARGHSVPVCDVGILSGVWGQRPSHIPSVSRIVEEQEESP